MKNIASSMRVAGKSLHGSSDILRTQQTYGFGKVLGKPFVDCLVATIMQSRVVLQQLCGGRPHVNALRGGVPHDE
jgi:hypothetical protein